jgi:hypothetical protein
MGEARIGTKRTQLMGHSQLEVWVWPVRGIGEGGLLWGQNGSKERRERSWPFIF